MAVRSLRGRLLRVVLPPVAVLLGLGAVGAFSIALESATEAYDQALVDVGLALGESVRLAGDRYVLDLPGVAERVVRTDRYDTIYYSVLAPEGGTIAGDPGLPPVPPGRVPQDAVITYDGSYRGAQIRVAAVLTPCGGRVCTVLIAETTRKRDRLVREIVLTSVVPELLIALLVLGIVWFGVKRGLDPLEVLSGEIKTRSADDLRPIDPEQAPDEARPLVSGINQLLERVAEASRNQQRFLANAAHQLRTPLAGLQAHAELALARERDGPARGDLEKVHSASVRTARLASQLLALARAEPGGLQRSAMQAVDLRQLVERETDEWVHRALAKDIDLGFELASASGTGDALLLREAFANLVHNALEYTPRGGHVTVRTRVEEGSACLEVEDSGPGIPPQERERVLERFYRLRDAPGTGSGLGLAIVREIAQLHGASLDIGSGAGGAGCRVTLRIPLREPL